VQKQLVKIIIYIIKIRPDQSPVSF